MFAFWDWVGGRYSLWSRHRPARSRCVDRHGPLRGAARRRPRDGRALPHRAAREEPAGHPGRCSASGTSNFFGAADARHPAYDQYMHRFAAYFQQGDMESNGKRVDREGTPIADYTTGPDRLGRAGHQRPARVLPADPPGHARSSRATSSRRSRRTTRSASITTILLANFFAQTEALMKRQDRRGGARRARGAEARRGRGSTSSCRTRRSPATGRRLDPVRRS